MTDKNIRTEESLDISENSNLLDNENNNEVDNVINNNLSEEKSVEDETTEKEEEIEESDTSINQEVDSDSDISEEDEVKDEDTTTTDDANTDEGNEEEDEYNSFNHPNNKIYSDNINALMFTKKIKEDAWERFINHKINFVKDNNISKVLSVIIISIVMFFIGRYMDKYIMVDNPGDTTLKITRFIVKYSYLLILYFGGILELIIDLFVIFLIELADLLMFLSNVSSYNILLKNTWLLKQFLDIKKDKEENDSDNNNNSKSIIVVAINGIFYLLIMGVLIPLDALTKGLNNLIIQIANGTCNLLLPTKMVNKKAPDMDINRFLNKNKQVKGVVEKDKEKEQKPKRGFFNRLRDRIKNYLNRIVTSNDRLINTLKDNNSNGDKNKTKTKTLGIVKEVKGKSKGKNTSKGKNKSRGRDGWERSLEGKERNNNEKETEAKGKDTTSKEQEKSGNNRGEVKEGNERTRQEVTTKSGQRKNDSSKSNLHDSITIDNQSKKETVVQQGNPVKSDNPNQGIGADNTTKTGDTTKESPKPAKQPSNFDFSNKKISEDFINKIERYELLVNGKVCDFNKNGQCAGMPLDEAKKFAAERSKGLENLNKGEERLENFKEKENQSKNLGDKEQDRSKQVDEKGDQLGKNISEQKEKNIGNKKDDINDVKLSEKKEIKNNDAKSTEHKEALSTAEDKKAKMAFMRAKVAQAKEKIEQGQVKSTTNPLQGVNISSDKKNTQTHMHKVNSPTHKPKSNNLPPH